MKFIQGEFKWQDYFSEEEWKKIQHELEEINREVENGTKLYTTEEMLESIGVENPKEMMKEIRQNVENFRKQKVRKYVKKIMQK